ncbi:MULTISPECIES: glycosyltransferase family 61 protein [Methylobacterium]|uniref:glycosyltransferase family 61 protein n=1 Tax=Methylobacterium TaxID=407 RepID=UPI0013ECD26C|nr:glycosyltransferase family 61 protein [Methylobacterium sp. DB0501]NGM34711.1 glycosyltransferase family 61 protein [Methylobacterium sp. DB0501]
MAYGSLLRPSDVFCAPRQIDSLDGCFFTHAIDLPAYGTMPGQWDMRRGVEDCLGFVDVRGKRVLHAGSDSGFLGFAMEQRGAEVVCLDEPGLSWDIVPFPQADEAGARRTLDRHLETIRRAYWFSHRALGSRVRLARGTPYAVPDLVGPAEIAVLNHALPRLRDPFRGLHAVARFARETMIVTDVAASRGSWLRDLVRPSRRPAFFVPRARRPEGWGSWWRLPPETVQEILAILGFSDSAVHRHRQLHLGAARDCYTVVARRTGPTGGDPADDDATGDGRGAARRQGTGMRRSLKRTFDLWGEARVMPEPPRLRVVENALYLPFVHAGRWGVFDAERRIVEESVDYLGPERQLHNQVTEWPPDAAGPIEDAPEEHYLYLGQLNPHYGHFIVNTLARFWPMLEAGARPRLLCHGYFGGHDLLAERPFVVEILDRLGLRLADLAVFDRPVRIRRLTVVAPALREMAFVHPVMAALGDAIGRASLAGVPVDAESRPVYLSKARLSDYVQRVENEDAMAEALSRAGIDIVYPETLTFDEQIRLLAQRRTIIASQGSALHTALFAPPGRSMIVLSPSPHVNATYLLIDAVKGHRSRYYHPQGLRSVQTETRRLTYFEDPLRLAEELVLRLEHPEVSDGWDELDQRATWHTAPSIPPLPPRLRRKGMFGTGVR